MINPQYVGTFSLLLIFLRLFERFLDYSHIDFTPQ